MTNFNRPQNFCTSPDEHTGADNGVSGSYLITSSSEGHLMEDGNIILNNGRFSHHETGRMIKKDPRSDAGRRMNIYPKNLTCETLKIKSHRTTGVMPEVISNPVSRNRKEALVVDQGLQSRVARRISIQDSLQVIARPFNKNRIFPEEAAQQGNKILERRILACKLTG